MVFGVGIDIENHTRFKKHQQNPELLLSVFTRNELDNYKLYDSHLCYAISFSCKEAFFKAFGNSWNNSPIQWTDIELIFKKDPEYLKTDLHFFGFALQCTVENKLEADYKYSINNNQIIFEAILQCKVQ